MLHTVEHENEVIRPLFQIIEIVKQPYDNINLT